MSLEDKLNRLFEQFGYSRFRMSKFEEYDLYASNRDFLTSSQLITFTDLDGSLLALKPDITLSIIKSTANARKVYYNEMVYRPKDRHYREIPQAGAECIGHIDPYQEAEVIALAAEALETIDRNYILRISDVSFLKTYLSEQGVEEPFQKFIIDAMDRKNADYLRRLGEEGILGRDVASVLVTLVDLYLPLPKGVKAVRSLIGNSACGAIMDHLEEIASLLKRFDAADHIFLDFSLVNSMDYYNGIVFQGALKDVPYAVLSGGRYDRLVEKMGKPFGAVGFAIYMDVVENYRHSTKHYDGDILIVYDDRERFVSVASLVHALRSQGKTVRAVNRADNPETERWKRVMTFKEAKKEAAL